MEDILYRVSTENPDVIPLTEIKPKNGDIPDEKELQINGYTLYLCKGYDNKNTRGTCVYVKSCFNSSIVSSPVSDKFEDCVWVKIEGDSKPLLIGNIYRSGSPNKSKTLDENLHNMIKGMALDKQFGDVVITGDFNHPDIQWAEERVTTTNPADIPFTECLADSYLQNYVYQPTRYRYCAKKKITSKSLLDLILANDENLIDNLQYNSHLGLSDHLTLTFEVNYACTNIPLAQSKTMYQYSKCNKEKMKNLLDINWSDKLKDKDVEESYSTFLAVYEDAVKKSVPTVKCDENTKVKPLWMKYSTEKLVKQKHHHWIRYLNTKKDSDYLEYKVIRNEVTKATKKDRKNFEHKLAREIKENVKAFWKYINRNKKRKNKIPVLKKPKGGLACSDEEKANALNNQFSSVFTLEHTPPPDMQRKDVTNLLTKITISEEDILKKLNNLRTDKSMGPDNVHPFILKTFAAILKTPLQIIFQLSLNSKTLPKIWKHGVIAPLFKKGNRKLPSNYRPISLTCIPCKLLESIVVDWISAHLTRNSLRDKNQHGFTVKKSTETNLLEAINIWTDALAHGLPIDVIYFDYEKAFDTVPHQRLLKQLDSYGITSDLLCWIEDFLSDRKQKVVINDASSEIADVSSGVPQGSVLGPLLFLIYVGDASKHVTNFCKLFADDTKIYARILENEQSIHSLQEDISSLSKWTNTMLMRYNLDKCHRLHLGRKNIHASYSIPSVENYVEKENSIAYNFILHSLKDVKEEKDLGVYIDNQLSFNTHIDTKIKIANKMLGIIRRNFKYMDSDIFNRLFKSIVRPHLEYASIIWAPTTKQYQDKIESLQRRATRQIPGLSHLSYSERLEKLKLPTLKYRRIRSCMLFLYKYTHGLVNVDLETGCGQCSHPLQPSLGRGRGHNLRFQIQHHQSFRNKFFTAYALGIWNSLQTSTVNASSINAFKNRLSTDKGMPNQYEYQFSY